MFKIRNIINGRVFALFFFSLSAISPQLMAETGKRIVILHTNDIHSHLVGFGPESAYSPLSLNDDKTVGGMARIATVFNTEKGHNGEINFIVDAGDFLMGTLFQSVEYHTGFQLNLMKQMGYDVVSLGNHEFDFGPVEIAEIISHSAERGDIPSLVLSNVVVSRKDRRDDLFEQLYAVGLMSTSKIIERGGLKVGFFGIMGKEADSNAPFAEPVRFVNRLRVARRMVKQLKSKGCDVIICLSHSGVKKDRKGRIRGEDYKLAKRVRGIDVIISGHTHTRLDKPVMVKGVPVVQTGEFGQYVGRMELIYKEGHVSVDNYRLIAVDDGIPGYQPVDRMIDMQKNNITDMILAPLRKKYDLPVAETDFPLTCGGDVYVKGSNLGSLVVDAVYDYVNKPGCAGTDIAMTAAGVIRDPVATGIQTVADIFRIMPMGIGNDETPGYPIAKVYVTGKELKNIMEILLFSSKSVHENYCFYSGVRVEMNPEKGFMRKTGRIEIVKPDGTAVEVNVSRKSNELYSITANTYLLASIDIIKKMTFGLIKVEPKDADGHRLANIEDAIVDMNHDIPGIQEGKEWIAIMDYLSSMPDMNGNGIPDIDAKYRKASLCFY